MRPGTKDGGARRSLGRGLLIASLLGAASAGAAPDPPPSVLTATAVASATRWEGPQYPGADGKGRVYLLRAHEFEVYPLERDGELGPPERLVPSPVSGPVVVLDAAMDRHGDWILRDGFRARWFRSGKEVALPELRWTVASVALRRGEPVVSVLPLRRGNWRARERFDPPLVLTAGEDDWSVVAESARAEPPELAAHGEAIAREETRLFADRGGDLWLAHRYRYRVVRLTGAGRERMTLEVGDAGIRERGADAVAAAAEAMETERSRLSEPERATVSVHRAELVILDLTEGPDGRYYLLVRGEDGALALDRFDPFDRVLERMPTSATSPGGVSIVAGRDGLYLVPFNGLESRWRIDWQDIETAPWAPVGEVRIDDFEVPNGE